MRSKDGILTRQIQAAAFIRISGLKTSRGWTIESVSEPMETTLTPMMPCLASSPQTRNCSRSTSRKQGPEQIRRADRGQNRCSRVVARPSRTSVTRYRGTA